MAGTASILPPSHYSVFALLSSKTVLVRHLIWNGTEPNALSEKSGAETLATILLTLQAQKTTEEESPGRPGTWS